MRAGLKKQRINAELGRIIEEMDLAMWCADKEYIARATSVVALTPNMRLALNKFKIFCEQHVLEVL